MSKYCIEFPPSPLTDIERTYIHTYVVEMVLEFHNINTIRAFIAHDIQVIEWEVPSATFFSETMYRHSLQVKSYASHLADHAAQLSSACERITDRWISIRKMVATAYERSEEGGSREAFHETLGSIHRQLKAILPMGWDEAIKGWMDLMEDET